VPVRGVWGPGRRNQLRSGGLHRSCRRRHPCCRLVGLRRARWRDRAALGVHGGPVA